MPNKNSQYFTKENQPDLNLAVTFDLIHTGDASAPIIGDAIDEVEAHLFFKQQRTKKRKSYSVSDAQSKALALLFEGSSIREAARLCGVPKSTVAVRRQTIWDQSARFLRDTFLPVTTFLRYFRFT